MGEENDEQGESSNEQGENGDKVRSQNGILTTKAKPTYHLSNIEVGKSVITRP
ncbi:hypothetical protein ACJJIF_20420 [Microbulbifer sp. SSSA002]|uniref:hypothetical protein n=1 Tax=unclassified Microbulbifer TaxID=2619833 RepID=UPI004039BFEA